FAPWPGAYTTFRGQTCHLWGEPAANDAALPAEIRADPSFASARSVPGALFGGKWDWFVACGKGTALRLQSVKLEGRKQVSAAEFANGARLKSDARFGDMCLSQNASTAIDRHCIHFFLTYKLLVF